MKIEVTQEDIDLALKPVEAYGGCPIGIAIRRTICKPLPNYAFQTFHVNYYGLKTSQLEHIATLPTQCYDFMSLFDKDLKVIPFSFNLSAECFMV